MLRVLIVYASREYPLRVAQRDHLWSFKKYAGDSRCYYLNVGFGSPPAWVRRLTFDLIIFDWMFLAFRPSRDWFRKKFESLLFLRESSAVKIALPQDEFSSMDLLCEFIEAVQVDYVFSVAPDSEWKKIYRSVDFQRVQFFRVLTGYLDDELVERFEAATTQHAARPIDIGYRTVSTAIWGRFNLLKSELASTFEQAVQAYGLVSDIKVGPEHFFQGDAWLGFLSRCKYTLGVEGGSSLLDWDGSISRRIASFRQQHPRAGYDAMAEACIPRGADGEIRVVAISPRQLEACLTKTCQILIEGDYNGILRPRVHYIELKSDFSNLSDVLSCVRADELRPAIVEAAYRDVVASGRYTYSSFVKFVLTTAVPRERFTHGRPDRERLAERFFYLASVARDQFFWLVAAMYTRARGLRRGLWKRG